jgi:hypothetical protein
MTYSPFLTGTTLYITNYDDDITEHFIKKNYFQYVKDNDDLLRSINKYIMYGSGLLTKEKTKRTIIGFSSLKLSSLSTTFLNSTIDKKTPDKTEKWAIGSNHGSEPFAASIITYKNLQSTNLNPYLKYGITGINYTLSTSIALSRVEPGGHSFGDQLINASVGNFLAIFVHDFFIVDENIMFNINLNKNSTYCSLKFKF